jgi:hypothetical protein
MKSSSAASATRIVGLWIIASFLLFAAFGLSGCTTTQTVVWERRIPKAIRSCPDTPKPDPKTIRRDSDLADFVIHKAEIDNICRVNLRAVDKALSDLETEQAK